MPGKKMNSIKDKPKYEALREQGMSKEQAAKIANADTKKAPAKKTGKKK